MFPSHFAQFFTPAQIAGYAAFLLGVAAFLQRDDRRLKILLAGESFSYLVHFVLLGNPPAASSAAVSGTRTLFSLRYRSKRLAVVFMSISIAFGAVLVNKATGWLPVLGTSFATWGLFTQHGIRMRLLVLVSTFLWLTNNIISGSIGGTVLEAFIAIASLSTIARMTFGAMGSQRST